MKLTNQINYCLAKSAEPTYVAWVNLSFAHQQGAEPGYQLAAQPPVDDCDVQYSYSPAHAPAATYLTRYTLTVK